MKPQQQYTGFSYREAAKVIESILKRTALRKDHDLYNGWCDDFGEIITLVPLVDVKITNPILFVRDFNGEFKLMTVLLTDTFAQLRKTANEGLVEVEGLVMEWLKDLHENQEIDFEPISFGMTGGRFSHTDCGSVLFGVGTEVIFVYHDLDKHDFAFEKEVSYKGKTTGIDLGKRMKVLVDHLTSDLMTLAYSCLPRAVVLLKAGNGKRDGS